MGITLEIPWLNPMEHDHFRNSWDDPPGVEKADLRVAAVARVVAHSSPAASLSPSALESCADPAFLGRFFTIKGCALT